MSRNTPALVAAFQAAPPIPADGNERAGVDWVKEAAAKTLPHLPTELVGDLLMHFVCYLDTIIDTIGDVDPMLDWESRICLARNIIGVAGMELHTGAELDAAPTRSDHDGSTDR